MRKINLLFLVLLLVAVFGFFLVNEAKAGFEHNVYGWVWIGGADSSDKATIGWVSMNCINQSEFLATTTYPVVPGEFLHGWGWSDNIGWICLNCDNDPGCDPLTEDYYISIDAEGILSGYAWSDSLGWLSFNSGDLIGCPEGDCEARYTTSTEEFSGWAKFLNATGSWDGFVRLNDGWEGMHVVKDNKIAGWAWGSEVVGWITFGGVCQAANYGVNIATSTGIFSGYAWSAWEQGNATSGIGWIKFDPAGPYPDSPNYSACINLPTATGEVCENAGYATNTISGWARAYRVIEPEGQTLGGWDGWIKLRGIWDSGVATGTYGAKLVGQKFEGWAWGGNEGVTQAEAKSKAVVGWMSFNCKDRGVCGTSDYKVMTSLSLGVPPSVSNPTSSWAGACDDSLHPTLKWTYSDGTQESYQVQIATSSADFEGTIILDKTAGTASHEYHPLSEDFSRDLEYGNKTYHWRVQVENQSEDWSGWSAISSFETPPHQYPYPSFSPERSYYNVDEVVKFIDDSTCYNGGAPLCKDGDASISYEWDFSYVEADGFNTEKTTKGNATATYDRAGRYTVMLCITDSSLAGFALAGKCCREGDAAVRVGIPLPEWKEIAPF